MVLNNKFTHCLRTQIFPDKFADERIDSILKFALKYGFKNIILMFNAEEFNTGHASIEELKPWIDIILKAKNKFLEYGITTSLNPWMEFGHLDRGRELKKNQLFENMVDKNGKKTKMVVCPLDETWRNFYLEKLGYYVSIIKPEILWIEDDFRLRNHDPLEWGGCFCENHLSSINKKLNLNLSREEIVNGIIKGGDIRKAWLEVSFETLSSLAKLISIKVKEVSPNTSVALMSSAPESHQMEGRHWNELLTNLSSDGLLIDRIHLPCYMEIAPRTYLYYFNAVSMVVRSFIKDDALIYPELENCQFSLFSKSPKFLSFQVESALPLGIKGMTYDIFEFVGNGVQNEFKYGEALSKLTPYLNAVKDLDLKPSELSGLTFPIDELSVLYRKPSSWDELTPDEHKGISIFSSLGYSFKLSDRKEFNNETIVLTDQIVNSFTDEQLKKLFKNNFIVLDGETAKQLIDRKLGHLINANGYEILSVNNGSYSFEMLTKVYKGIHHYRGSLERFTGNYVLIKYNDSMPTYSNVYNYNHKKVGPGLVKKDNYLINPFIYSSIDYATFGSLKDYLFSKLIPCSNPLIKSPIQGIYSYLFSKRDKYILFISNTYDDISRVNLLSYNFTIKKITAILHNGEKKEVKFIYRNNKLIIHTKIPYLTTIAFIIE